MTTRTAAPTTSPANEGIWAHQHVLDLDDFRRGEIETVLDLADRMREILDRRIARVPALRGHTVMNLFYEASTRTRAPLIESSVMLGMRLSQTDNNAAQASLKAGSIFLMTSRIPIVAAVCALYPAAGGKGGVA